MNSYRNAHLCKTLLVLLMLFVTVLVPAFEEAEATSPIEAASLSATSFIGDDCNNEGSPGEFNCDNCQHCQTGHSDYHLSTSVLANTFHGDTHAPQIHAPTSALEDPFRPPIV